MNPADAENTTKLNASQELRPILLNETELVLELGLRQTTWVNGAGRTILLADYRVGGEVWQVHKSDADPYPSGHMRIASPALLASGAAPCIWVPPNCSAVGKA
ncbi:hypothetical protein [Achromobacter sp. DH1f]|uniref:hypothetical protein n=1 Tax=Achromobacter sp. DH1f TaxID=1397275 RepID=UPI0012FEF890|nr:hypothetical protein [Achromobacter sp. DH1f]